MKFRRRPLQVSILLLQLLQISQASSSSRDIRGSANEIIIRDVDSKEGQGPDPTISSTLLSKGPAPGVVGTKDAPVDGKDGRPHAGPFVETSAERDRKKAKESGEDEGPISGKKPVPKKNGDSYVEGWDKALPESNDGVMDDPNRSGPKEGTRGTEGGISEKTKDKMAQDGQDVAAAVKLAEKPKGVPPSPPSEQERVRTSDTKESVKSDKVDFTGEDTKVNTIGKEVGGLEKPTDLPSKPHDLPHPVPASASKDDPLEISKPLKMTPYTQTESTSLIQPLHSFLLSFIMIIFSEIGDKTFLVAALMAMKHPPLFVFSASFPAMIVMTILSVVLGHAVPTLIPTKFTNFAAAALFLVFGGKMLREGYAIRPGEGVGQEMKEVEMELEEKEAEARKMGRRRSSVAPYMLEGGRMDNRKSRSNSRLPAPPASPPSSPDSRSPSPSRGTSLSNILTGVNNLFSLLLSPAWVQTFMMTFLGEWGDRSQIATIAMAAGQDYWWVTAGALTGHAICIAIAVIGGRAIAGRVSLRVITLGGGFCFLAFGIIYLMEALYYR